MTLIRLCATSVKAGQTNGKGFQVAEKSCERFHLRRNVERRITCDGLVQILINDNNFVYIGLKILVLLFKGEIFVSLQSKNLVQVVMA